MESVAKYGEEVRTINKYFSDRLLALEMDYLRRSPRKSKLQYSIASNKIGRIMEAEVSIMVTS